MSIQIVQAVTVPEGDGVEVKRLMPVARQRNFDPFVLWDHFDIAAGGFPNHPHRGFEAITYMFAGGMQHTDNLGNRGTVHGGGAQRFTAGKGIVHSEMPDGHAAGIQLWINLPQRLKGIDPAYQQVAAIPQHNNDGVHIRTIVGDGGAITLNTVVEYLDVCLDAKSTWQKPIAEGFRGLLYMITGSVRINGEPLPLHAAAFVEDETQITIECNQEARLMFCFGKPHGEPIYQHGPYVD
jgi:redox-sensitive bicupin YhaK (pirin superfamily)